MRYPRAVTLLGAAFCFILAQAAQLALSHRICTGTDAKIDGSWIATFLETITVALIFAAWKMVTEDEWDVRLVSPTLAHGGGHREADDQRLQSYTIGGGSQTY